MFKRGNKWNVNISVINGGRFNGKIFLCFAIPIAFGMEIAIPLVLSNVTASVNYVFYPELSLILQAKFFD